MAGRDLSRVKDRDALRPSPNAEPYWQRLRPGCSLGYSPSARGGEGTWFARAYDADRGRYQKKSLGPRGFRLICASFHLHLEYRRRVLPSVSRLYLRVAD